MLECSPSLKDTIARGTNATWLTRGLEKAGLITSDQRGVLRQISDAKVKAAILIGMVTTRVYCNSKNFTTFLDVLKKDETTYGHILAQMKEKGVYCNAPRLHVL